MWPHATGTDGARARRARHIRGRLSSRVFPKVRGGGSGLCFALQPCARCLVFGWCRIDSPLVGASDLRSCVDPVCVICRECCMRTVNRFINRVLFSGTHVERLGVFGWPSWPPGGF